jgi:hypothetical protein
MPAFATAPGDDFAVAGVDDERTAHDVAVPTGELDATSAPAQGRAHGRDLAVAGARNPSVQRRTSSKLCPCMIRQTRLRFTAAAVVARG